MSFSQSAIDDTVSNVPELGSQDFLITTTSTGREVRFMTCSAGRWNIRRPAMNPSVHAVHGESSPKEEVADLMS
jgi:hypothetical protein